MPLGGYRLSVLLAIVFAALAFRATAYYTTRYQTLPVLDWLDAHTASDARSLPTANDMVHGLLDSAPMLVIRDDARPYQPVFGPPAIVQRTMGGVRDAAAIDLAPAGAFTPEDLPIRAHLNVNVFYT